MKNNPLISICCITYNHEKFIKKALDGILNQKTNYRYEILIYDDASKDKTADIIKEYQKKYPEKIFPILHDENQYSKGVSVNYQFNLKRAKGKYIALCEGDDYWIDEQKLQKQVEFMEKNEKCMLSFHNANVVDINGEYLQDFLSEKKNYFSNFKSGSKVYTTREMVILGFIPTASLVFKKEAIVPPKKYYFNRTCGDLPLCLMACSRGTSYFIDEKMSSYRRGNPNSASASAIINQDNIRKYVEGVIDIYNKFNEDTNYVFDIECKYRIKAKRFEGYMLANNISKMKSEEYREFYNKFSKTQKISFMLKSKTPIIYRFIKKIYIKSRIK